MNKLEQAAQNLLDYFDIDDCGILFDSHMEALREALAEQEEQEPVALIEECREALAQELMAYDIDPPIHHVKQAHDKCVAWLSNHAAPVRTKDLTDDEIMKINVDTASIVPTCDRQFHFARAVIAADRSKNGIV